MRIDVPWGTGTTPVEVDARRVAGVLGANVEQGGGPRGDTARGDRGAGRRVRGVPGRGARRRLLVVVNDCYPADALGRGPAGAAARAWRSGCAAPDRQLLFRHRHRDPPGGAARGDRPPLRRRPGCGPRRPHLSPTTPRTRSSWSTWVARSRGTEIQVNRLLAEARSVLVINSVEPHYFAGYTGGRKSLFPGIGRLRDRVGQPQALHGARLRDARPGRQPGARGPRGSHGDRHSRQADLLHPTGARQGPPRGFRGGRQLWTRRSGRR